MPRKGPSIILVTVMANILVIDSEPTVRTVISRILERGGHSISSTGQFEQAIEMLRKEPQDLVVTNVFLRGIAGHDAMFILKREFPSVPVLMVSGLPDERVIAEWVGEPGFDVFPKPFASDDLLRKVTQVLEA